MDELSAKIKINLPKGSAAAADAIGKVVYLKYGEEIFESIAKKNFKNYLRITNQ